MRGHSRSDDHTTSAAHGEAGNQDQGASHEDLVPGLIAELKVTWRMRQALLRAERRLSQQIKAVERQVGRATMEEVTTIHRLSPATIAALATLPLAEAQRPITKQKRLLDRRLAKLVEGLPVFPWAKAVRGLGPLNLAGIIAETGDLSLYANPAKVWKRMGLAVVDGQRQRRMAGAEALEHDYSAARRSVVWNAGESLVKMNGAGPYRAAYDARKAYELAREPEMKPAKAHARAKRYAEKRLLRDLWRAWRQAANAPAADTLTPEASVPAHPPLPIDPPRDTQCPIVGRPPGAGGRSGGARYCCVSASHPAGR